MRGEAGKGKPKQTIFASGGLGLLQMVPELDTGRCASEEVEPRWRVDMRRCVSKDAGPKGGELGGPKIDWRKERMLARMLGSEGGGL